MINKIVSSPAVIAVILSMLFFQGCRLSDKEIASAVNIQLKNYPASSLQDIYKSFFQDEFGPGHLLGDSAGAWEYLEYELTTMESSRNHDAEPCGTGENFYRVPLDLVKDGVISDKALFSAFMESASKFRLPDIESWKKKWEEIEAVIEGMNLNLPNYEQDKKALSVKLDRGETAVHHSLKYEELYKPHYRIIGKEQWEILRGKYLH